MRRNVIPPAALHTGRAPANHSPFREQPGRGRGPGAPGIGAPAAAAAATVGAGGERRVGGTPRTPQPHTHGRTAGCHSPSPPQRRWRQGPPQPCAGWCSAPAVCRGVMRPARAARPPALPASGAGPACPSFTNRPPPRNSGCPQGARNAADTAPAHARRRPRTPPGGAAPHRPSSRRCLLRGVSSPRRLYTWSGGPRGSRRRADVLVRPAASRPRGEGLGPEGCPSPPGTRRPLGPEPGGIPPLFPAQFSHRPGLPAAQHGKQRAAGWPAWARGAWPAEPVPRVLGGGVAVLSDWVGVGFFRGLLDLFLFYFWVVVANVVGPPLA